MAEQQAWVTLATNDAYCLGALVLAHSLQRAGTTRPIVVLITPQVTQTMQERLASVFTKVVTVDVLDSKDAAHLALLARPELGITFTKLHCWQLTEYAKCVFLDADTIVFQNCDELFEREELSAAPDVGWPDCFNSGVFVYRPSNETFDALIKFANEKGSFDGGDQGLLNGFFSNWAREDIAKHLPFVYNVTSTAFYSYLPALKQFGADTKILHFIGNLKPWLQKFNWTSRSVDNDTHMQAPLQYWWNIFLEKVHPTLDTAMVRWECGASNEALYSPPRNDLSPFPWHHTPPPEEVAEDGMPRAALDDFYDPWDGYRAPAPPPQPQLPPTPPSSPPPPNDTNDNHHQLPYQVIPWYENYVPETPITPIRDNNVDYEERCGPGGSHCGTVSYDFDFEHAERTIVLEQYFDCESERAEEEETRCQNGTTMDCGHQVEDRPRVEEVRPRHPYDNYYLNHTIVLDLKGCKRCSHEESPPPPPLDPSPSPTPSVDSESDLQAGIAGALAQMSLGEAATGSAVEEHLRRQGWEAGNIDYMGADAFNNIWAKISQTLSEPPPAPSAPEQSAAPVEAPPKAAEASPKAEEAPKPQEEPASQARAEEKRDSEIKSPDIEKNATTSSSDVVQIPKPPEKLMCHLKPAEGQDTLPTPENEHEDAASIASSIIASETMVHATVTSPTSPTTICSAVPQNVRNLHVDTAIPETPPVPGPVSLAQIGIVPAAKQVQEDLDSLTNKASTISLTEGDSICAKSNVVQEKTEEASTKKTVESAKQSSEVKKSDQASRESAISAPIAKQVDTLSDLSAKETQGKNKTVAESTSSEKATTKKEDPKSLKIDLKESIAEAQSKIESNEPATPTKAGKKKIVAKSQSSASKADSKPSTPEPPKSSAEAAKEPILSCPISSKTEVAETKISPTPSTTIEPKEPAPSAQPKPKRIIKKPSTEEPPKAETESKKSEETPVPVPPPRKKEKKVKK